MGHTETEAKRRLRAVVSRMQDLPVLPAVAVQALGLSLPSPDGASDRSRATALAGSDPALALRLLRLAAPASGLAEAVRHLSSTALAGAFLGLTVRDAFLREGKRDPLHPLHVELWRHSLATAAAARLLAEAAGADQAGRDEAYAAGLLHDAGRLVILCVLPGEYAALRRKARERRLSLSEAEEAAFGVHHGLVGKWLAQRFSLPQALAESVWLHHQPLGSLSLLAGRERLVLLVKLADCLAHEVLGDYTAPALGDGEFKDLLSALRLWPSDVESVLSRLKDELDTLAAPFDQDTTAAACAQALQRAASRLCSLALDLDRKAEALGQAGRVAAMTSEAGLRLARSDGARDVLHAVAEALRGRLAVERGLVHRVRRRGKVLEGVAWEPGEGLKDVACLLDGDFSPVRDARWNALPTQVKAMLRNLSGRLSAFRPEPEDGAAPHPVASGRLLVFPVAGEEGLMGEICLVRSGPKSRLSAREQAGCGQLAALAAVSLDRVREREELEERAESLTSALRKSRRTDPSLRQAERLAAVGRLAAGAAQEMVNPLSIIYARTQLLQAGEQDPARKKSLAQMTGQMERLSAILADLVGFASLSPPGSEPLPLGPLLERAIGQADLSRADIRPGIRLERDLAPDLPAVRGDSGQLEAAFRNLLLNARQAMEGKGGTLRISARVVDNGRQVAVRIVDQGVGIPEEDLERIFDPFFTTRVEGEGSGLGLSAAYGAISAHGGRIEVRSRVGRGTEVTVLLPAEAPDEAGPAPMPGSSVSTRISAPVHALRRSRT